MLVEEAERATTTKNKQTKKRKSKLPCLNGLVRMNDLRIPHLQQQVLSHSQRKVYAQVNEKVAGIQPS